jgi:hypothetical protein
MSNVQAKTFQGSQIDKKKKCDDRRGVTDGGDRPYSTSLTQTKKTQKKTRKKKLEKKNWKKKLEKKLEGKKFF